MNNSYRLDTRTIDEFKRTIKSYSKKEAIIAVRLGIHEYNKTNVYPPIYFTGVDGTGEYQEKVNSNPDFMIGDRLVEITQSAHPTRKGYYHQKCNKVEKIIKLGSCIVYVDGFDTEAEPNTVVIEPERLKVLTDMSIKEFGIKNQPTSTSISSKPAYRYRLSWTKDLEFPLPKLEGDLPQNYIDLLKIFNINYEINIDA